MRYVVAVIVAAAAGSLAYSFGLGSEVAYVVRSITRHFLSGVIL